MERETKKRKQKKHKAGKVIGWILLIFLVLVVLRYDKVIHWTIHRLLPSTRNAIIAEETEASELYGDNWVAQLNAAAEGTKVMFGCYEQDNDLTNGAEPICWTVLKRTDGELWLLSEKLLDSVPYYLENVENELIEGTDGQYYYMDKYGELIPFTSTSRHSWLDSDLCRWLNSEFAAAAFTEQQLGCLKDSNSVIMENYGENYVYCQPERESTGAEQRIRLLTSDEAISFLFNSEVITNVEEYEASGHKSGYEYVFEYTIPGEGYQYDVYLRNADGTPYAIANGLEKSSNSNEGKWWLLTDDFDSTAEYVYFMGCLSEMDVDQRYGVRPLICIDLAGLDCGEKEQVAE